MRFPNAALGVKRIFTAEILDLIAAVCAIIGVAMLIPAAMAQDDTGVAVGGGAFVIFVIAAGILGLIAFIMKIVGINKAKDDEESFRSALIFLFVGIACSILGSALSSVSPVASSILSTAQNIMNVFVTVFVITSIVKLADRLNRGDISARGSNLLKILIAIYALSIIANIIVAIMGGQTASIVAAIIAMVAAILSVIQYILYLSFLAKAKKMLEEN